MKPITHAFIVVVAVALCLPLSGQDPGQQNVKNKPIADQSKSLDNNSGGAGGSLQNLMQLGEECGMYLCEDWKPGVIRLRDGKVLNDRLIRYNIYNQQMEYAYAGDTAGIGNPEELDRLEIDDKIFVYREFLCKNKMHSGYLELLVEGKYELLYHRGIRYVVRDNPEGSETGGPVASYYQDNRYFLSCEGKIAEQLPEKRNAIIASLDGNEKELKAYVKEHKCKLKSQEELVGFFEFANTD